MEKLNIHNEQQDDQDEITQHTGENEQPPHFLGTTRDGKRVYLRPDSHFHGEDGITYKTLEEAIPYIETNDQDRVVSQVEFERPIGIDKCVEVSPEDEVMMVYRKGRAGQTPMVKNREPEESNLLQVMLKKNEAAPSEYALVTTFVGKSAPKEPWDPSLESEAEKQESLNFWNTHALIYNEELVDWERTKPAN